MFPSKRNDTRLAQDWKRKDVHDLGPLSFNASRAACQDSVAHLMRAGNAWTPANAASSLNSSGVCPVLTISWKSLNSSPASVAVFPFNCVVIKDAEACEIAQPEPSNEIS